ncbi:Tetratricopeptide repeat [Phytophthora cactorum]|nr:Tetratricopeptide repeat [Phytophthora cactorum]
MEILQGEFLNELDGENQALRTNSGNLFTFEEAEAAEDVSSVLPESSIETNSQGVTQSLRFPSRKVHSAASISNGFGLNEMFDAIPRPYTAAGAEEFPSSSRQRNKKLATVLKKTARGSKTPREDRPRSAGVNEWGDFDTDRLLRDDFEEPSNQMPLDPLDRQRSRSRKSRRSTPMASSPSPNPWEGYLTLDTESKESSRPPMQVLRQKTIEILNLDLVVNQPSGRASATPKPLLSRASMERLMSPYSRPVTSHTSPITPLFGTEIPNTPTNRAAIFGRFADLWSLLSRRSSESESAEAENIQTKSPVECSTIMVKLCKTVGISFTSSVATRLSFWNTNEQGVDFESFCDLVIQGAIQPALHHFNLDNSIAEYVAALDIITESLVATEATRRTDKTSPDQPRRLKQLNEIRPVFMSWKAGVTPRLVQSTEASTFTPTKTLVTAEKVRKALEASASQHMLAHQLPSEEARVTHVENIRRKVQLHKSWKFSDEQRIATSQVADLAEMLDRARTVFPASAGSDDIFHRGEEDHPEQPFTAGEANDPEKELEAENEEVLVCCSCSIRGAKPLLGPTALAMTKTRSGSATLRPPVAMIYLPTKAMMPGTLAKGNPIARHNNVTRNSSNQVNAIEDEIPSVVANAILPSLHKSRSTGTIPRHYDRPQVETTHTRATDSTADLVKSLVLQGSGSLTAADQAEALRQQGNASFKRRQFQEAKELYTQAIQLQNGNHLLFGNRSAACHQLKEYEEALKDAEMAIKLSPKWTKGYLRKAAACESLQDRDEATAAYEEILRLEDDKSSTEANKAAERVKVLKRKPTEKKASVVLDDGVFAKLLQEDEFQRLIYPGIPKEQLVHAPKNLQTLLEDPWYEQELLALMPKVQAKAASVLANVKKRGAQQGDIMDPATERMLMPQVLQEAFGREVVAMVHRVNYQKHIKLANDARLLADPNSDFATWDQLDDKFLDELFVVKSDVRGVAVMDEFMGEEWTQLLLNDMFRMAKNGLLMSTVPNVDAKYVLSRQNADNQTESLPGAKLRFVEHQDCTAEYPAIAELIEKLHALPYEINKKRPEKAKLCAQFVHCTAIHQLPPGHHQPLRLDCGVGDKDNGFKLTCVYFFNAVESRVAEQKRTRLKLRTSLSENAPMRQIDPESDRLVVFRSQSVLNEITAVPEGEDLFYLTFWIHGQSLE